MVLDTNGKEYQDLIGAISVVPEEDSGKQSVVLNYLKSEGVVMKWGSIQEEKDLRRISSIREVTEGNVNLLNDLWELLARYNVTLSLSQQIALYRDFLDSWYFPV